jgi:hypothetical protein
MISCQIYIRRPEDDVESDIHDWLCIHDTRNTNNKLISPVCVIEKNRISTLTFKVHPNSPAYSLLTTENSSQCEVWVCERAILSHEPEYAPRIFPQNKWYQEEQVGDDKHVYRYDLFVGHVVEYTPYYAENGLLEANIVCVDHMDYLSKGIIPYTTFKISDVPSDQVENGETAWFRHFVEVYNSERGEQKNEFYRDDFKADTDKGKHTNNYTYVIDFENAYDAINEKFIDRWGGVFVTDLADYVDVGAIPTGGDKYPGGIHVRWISDSLYGRGTRDVTIEKGVNLKSLTITTDTSEYCTRVYPVGALQDNGQRQSLKDYSGHGHDPDTTYVNNPTAEENGVVAVVNEWSDVSTKENLYNRAVEFLNNNRIRKSYDASVLDLSVIGDPENRFRCGDKHRIIQPDMNVDEELQIIRIEYDLAQLQNVQITFGDKIVNASEQRKNTIVKNKEKLESITQILGGA